MRKLIALIALTACTIDTEPDPGNGFADPMPPRPVYACTEFENEWVYWDPLDIDALEASDWVGLECDFGPSIVNGSYIQWETSNGEGVVGCGCDCLTYEASEAELEHLGGGEC